MALLAAQMTQGKAGVCFLANEDRVWDRMQQWLRAWRLCPERPSDLLDRGGRLISPGATARADRSAGERLEDGSAAHADSLPGEPDALDHARALDLARHDPRLPSPYAHNFGRGIVHRSVTLYAIWGRGTAVEVPPWETSDELVPCIRSSKTDQYNMGEFRNHFLSGDADLGVNTAMARYAAAHPDRYRVSGRM
eukprot:2258204-Heterocapsa_arctica.AAC.1